MPTDASVEQDVSALVVALLDAADAPGAAVCLLVDGRPVLVKGIGFADRARTRPLPADAPFALYSVAKILLAVAALRLVEGGRLGLDAPLPSLLPGLPLDPGVTLRRALNHTGGLPDYGGLAAYHADLRADPGTPWTPEGFLARTLPLGLRFAPGDGWAYSNIGYLLVRRVIERATGQPLRDALATLIFRPLGLRRTALADGFADVQDLTPGHSVDLDDDGALHDVARRYHPGWVSHGLVVSTASETAQILEALLAGHLLGPSTLAQMLDAVPVPVDHPLIAHPDYGLGLMIERGSPSGPVAGHGGGGPGYSTAAFHFSDVAGHRLTSVALVNRDGHDLGMGIAFAMARTVADRFA